MLELYSSLYYAYSGIITAALLLIVCQVITLPVDIGVGSSSVFWSKILHPL